jgi:hypothetical protein
VHKVLKWATEKVDNPDLRDRGFMYWRLLAHSTKVASGVVLNDQLIISTDTDRMERGALDQLLLHTGTLSSIYHKNPDVSYIIYARRTRLMLGLDIHTGRQGTCPSRQSSAERNFAQVFDSTPSVSNSTAPKTPAPLQNGPKPSQFACVSDCSTSCEN